MSLQDDVLRVMGCLQIATPLMVAKCLSPPADKLHSVRVQAQREMNKLVDLKRLDRREKYYVITGCDSQGGAHAIQLSEVTVKLLSLYPKSLVYREKAIPEKGIRPDLTALLVKDNMAVCLIVEVVISEDPNYTDMKRRVWSEWPEASQYLSQLFQTKIPGFHFVTSDELDKFLEDL